MVAISILLELVRWHSASRGMETGSARTRRSVNWAIQELSEFQKDRRITKLPDLLSYTAYVLFFPSLFAGPAFDYREFERWLDCTMFDVDVPDVKRGGTKKKRKIPKSSIPATRKAVQGIAWILVFTWLSSQYPSELYTGDEFTEYSLLRR